MIPANIIIIIIFIFITSISANAQEFDNMKEYNISSNISSRLDSSEKDKKRYKIRKPFNLKDFLKRSKLWNLYRKFVNKHPLARSVFIWTLSVVEIPIMLLTLYALFSFIKSNRVASVFVIQLILSDLMQMICLIILTWDKTEMVWSAYHYSLIVGVYFMACIACERYVLVAHPVWHKTHQTLKSSCLISVLIWFVPLIFAKIVSPYLYFDRLRRSLAYLIPYPVIILCFVGTWRALSHSISLTSQKRRRILGTLFLVLLSYTFLIIPNSIIEVCMYVEIEVKQNDVSSLLTLQKVFQFFRCLLYLNPLADCLLYLFMRTDAADVFSSLKCCCRSKTQQISVRYTTRTSQCAED